MKIVEFIKKEKGGVIPVIDSLMDKRMMQKFDRVAKEKAKVYQKEQEAVECFLQNNSKETIMEVLKVVSDKGHPCEQKSAQEIKNKYLENNLEFDDIMTLDKLYKSNYKEFKNKEDTKR